MSNHPSKPDRELDDQAQPAASTPGNDAAPGNPPSSAAPPAGADQPGNPPYSAAPPGNDAAPGNPPSSAAPPGNDAAPGISGIGQTNPPNQPHSTTPPVPQPAPPNYATNPPAGTNPPNYTTNPPPGTNPPNQPPPNYTTKPPSQSRNAFDSFFNAVRRIGVWRTDDRWVGGVAAGIAHRLRVDPLVIRALFVVLGLLGIGVLLYGVAWLLLPEASDGRIHLREVLAGRVTAGFVGATIASLCGLSGGPWTISAVFSIIPWGLIHIWPITVLLLLGIPILVIVLVVNSLKGRKTAPAGAAPFPSDPGSQTMNQTANQPAQTTSPLPVSPGITQPVTAGTIPQPPDGSAIPQTPSAPFAAQATQAAQAPHTPAAPYGPPARPSKHARPTQYPPLPTKPPRRPGAGALVAGIVGAMTLFIIAALILVDRYSGLLEGTFVAGIGLGAILLMVGLVIVILGILGRRAGGLTAFALVGTILLLPALVLLHVIAVVPSGLDIASRSWHPTDSSNQPVSYSVGIGEARLDLSDLDWRTAPNRIQLTVGVGDAVVVVPENAAVRVETHVSVGTVESNLPAEWVTNMPQGGIVSNHPADDGSTTWRSDSHGTRQWSSTVDGGLGLGGVIESPQAAAGQPTRLTVVVSNSIGRVRVLTDGAEIVEPDEPVFNPYDSPDFIPPQDDWEESVLPDNWPDDASSPIPTSHFTN